MVNGGYRVETGGYEWLLVIIRAHGWLWLVMGGY